MSAPDELFTLEPAANGLGSPSGSGCSEVCEPCGVQRGERCWGHCVGYDWERYWKPKIQMHDRTMQMAQTMKTL